MIVSRVAVASSLLLIGGVLPGCDDTIEPRAVMEVRIVPDSAHLAPGESMEFEPRPQNRDGVEMPERRSDVEWSFTPTSLGDIVPLGEGGRARLTATQVGSGNVRATVLRRGGSVPVHVHPPGLDRIEVDPDPVITSDGVTVAPRAVLLDPEGEELNPDGFRISWQTADTLTARIPIGFTGISHPAPATRVAGRTTEGETILRLIVNGRTVTVPVIVTPGGAVPDEVRPRGRAAQRR